MPSDEKLSADSTAMTFVLERHLKVWLRTRAAEQGKTMSRYTRDLVADHRRTVEKRRQKAAKRRVAHPMIDMRDKDAIVVECPWCGEQEAWTQQEFRTHGKCRRNAEPCAVCPTKGTK